LPWLRASFPILDFGLWSLLLDDWGLVEAPSKRRAFDLRPLWPSLWWPAARS
jgi:hypothetical protein